MSNFIFRRTANADMTEYDVLVKYNDNPAPTRIGKVQRVPKGQRLSGAWYGCDDVSAVTAAQDTRAEAATALFQAFNTRTDFSLTA